MTINPLRIQRRTDEPVTDESTGEVTYKQETVAKVSDAEKNDTVFFQSPAHMQVLADQVNQILSSKGLMLANFQQLCSNGAVRTFIGSSDDQSNLASTQLV